MVPARAAAKLVGTGTNWDEASSKIIGENISTEKVDDGLIVRAVGVSAHASYPQEGVNAVALLTSALLKSQLLPGLAGWLGSLYDFASDNSGALIGILGSDEVSGHLTSNLGVLASDEKSVTASFSVRYPVTWKGDDVKSRIEKALEKDAFSLKGWKDSPPLYVPIDDPLLETLLAVYRSETGDMNPPKTMGGGTYARSMKKAVAFGPNFPGFPDVAHKADEFWYVDDLIKSARIYAKALARLAVR
jgi:succinyl-diaminopimelate desuccinylase